MDRGSDIKRINERDMKKKVKWSQIIKKNEIEIKVKPGDETDEVVENTKHPKPVQTAHVKDMKPQKSATRKIERRGVK